MKVFKYVICLLAMGLLTVSSSAFCSGAVVKPGEGWQHCNHTNDGGPGPHFGTPDDIELSCLSAIASQNPVLIMDACDLLDGNGNDQGEYQQRQIQYGPFGPKS